VLSYLFPLGSVQRLSVRQSWFVSTSSVSRVQSKYNVITVRFYCSHFYFALKVCSLSPFSADVLISDIGHLAGEVCETYSIHCTVWSRVHLLPSISLNMMFLTFTQKNLLYFMYRSNFSRFLCIVHFMKFLYRKKFIHLFSVFWLLNGDHGVGMEMNATV
jgi:hypothetical protein